MARAATTALVAPTANRAQARPRRCSPDSIVSDTQTSVSARSPERPGPDAGHTSAQSLHEGYSFDWNLGRCTYRLPSVSVYCGRTIGQPKRATATKQSTRPDPGRRVGGRGPA